MDKCYEIQPNDRLFPYTKHLLNHEMLRGCKKSGVKKIRVHDLRHSHASLLIEMGCQPLLIADRLGHEKIQTTLNTYSHLYPNKQAEVAQQLENLINGTTVPDTIIKKEKELLRALLIQFCKLEFISSIQTSCTLSIQYLRNTFL